MSFQSIRNQYGVPAKRGVKIRFADPLHGVFNCTIKSAKNGRLSVLVDDRRNGYRGRMILHPTWNVEYIQDEGETK